MTISSRVNEQIYSTSCSGNLQVFLDHRNDGGMSGIIAPPKGKILFQDLTGPKPNVVLEGEDMVFYFGGYISLGGRIWDEVLFHMEMVRLALIGFRLLWHQGNIGLSTMSNAHNGGKIGLGVRLKNVTTGNEKHKDWRCFSIGVFVVLL